MSPADDEQPLAELEARLRELSHNIDALRVVQEFSQGLKKTKFRQAVFNREGALLVRPPITFAEGRKRGLIAEDEDEFALLQGDIIVTGAAYHMGERLARMRFLVANSTCDLVPGRREFAALLPIQPILFGVTEQERAVTAQLLSDLLKFTSTRRMYLPPLPGDAPNEIVANVVELDRIAQARLDGVLLSERVASLSLVGWRIFASHLRGILTRTGEGEVTLRKGWR